MSSLQPAAGTRVRLARLERRRGLGRRLSPSPRRFFSVRGRRRRRRRRRRTRRSSFPPFARRAFRARAEVRAGSGVPPCPARAVLGASASANLPQRAISTRRRGSAATPGQSLSTSAFRGFRFSLFERGRRRGAERRLRAAERRGGGEAPEEANAKKPTCRRRARGGPSPGNLAARGASLELGARAPRPRRGFLAPNPGSASSAQTPRGGVERPRAASAAARVGEPGSDGFDASSSTSSYSSLSSLANPEPPSTLARAERAARVRRPTRTPAQRTPLASSHPRLSPQGPRTRRARAVRRRRRPRGERAQRARAATTAVDPGTRRSS